MRKMTELEFKGMACVLGPMAAIALRDFESTLTGVPDDGQKFLIRAWIALEEMPRDAGAEKSLLRDALCKLRDEWNGDTGQLDEEVSP